MYLARLLNAVTVHCLYPTSLSFSLCGISGQYFSGFCHKAGHHQSEVAQLKGGWKLMCHANAGRL